MPAQAWFPVQQTVYKGGYRAQPTLEYLCAVSPLIVKGRIVEYEVLDQESYGVHTAYPITVTIEATHWFRGGTKDSFKVSHWFTVRDDQKINQGKLPDLDNLIESRAERTWFLRPVANQPSFLTPVTQCHYKFQNYLDLDPDSELLFQSMSGRGSPIESGQMESLLAEAAKEDYEYLDLAYLWNPRLNPKPNFSGDETVEYLIVVGGKRLEELALNLINHPDEFLSSMTNGDDGRGQRESPLYEYRTALTIATGVYALTQFRSEENIRLLKSIQSNGEWCYRPTGNRFVKEDIIHSAVRQVLVRWGEPMEESSPRYFDNISDAQKQRLIQSFELFWPHFED